MILKQATSMEKFLEIMEAAASGRVIGAVLGAFGVALFACGLFNPACMVLSAGAFLGMLLARGSKEDKA